MDGRGSGGRGRGVNRFVELLQFYLHRDGGSRWRCGSPVGVLRTGLHAQPVSQKAEGRRGRRRETEGGGGGGGVGEAGGLWLNNSDPVVDTAAAAPGTTGAGSRHISRSGSLALFLLSLALSLSLSFLVCLRTHVTYVRSSPITARSVSSALRRARLQHA